MPVRAGRFGMNRFEATAGRGRRNRTPCRDPAQREGPNRQMRDVVIHVCVTCRREGDDPDARRPGARLHQALVQTVCSATQLVPVECLGNCKRACTVSLSAPGAWTYVFGDLTPASGPEI